MQRYSILHRAQSAKLPIESEEKPENENKRTNKRQKYKSDRPSDLLPVPRGSSPIFDSPICPRRGRGRGKRGRRFTVPRGLVCTSRTEDSPQDNPRKPGRERERRGQGGRIRRTGDVPRKRGIAAERNFRRALSRPRSARLLYWACITRCGTLGKGGAGERGRGGGGGGWRAADTRAPRGPRVCWWSATLSPLRAITRLPAITASIY